MKRISYLLLVAMALVSCSDAQREKDVDVAENMEEAAPVIPEEIKEYGMVLNDYEIVRDTVRSGDSFGNILQQHGVGPGTVYQLVEAVKDTFNPRRIVIGKPYVILKAKDSANTPQKFIYENDLINYTVVNLADSLSAYTAKKPVSIKRKTVTGVIRTSLSDAIQEQGLNYLLTHELNNIYMWSIDFFRLQKGDRFKMVVNERFVNDTIYAGIESVEAAEFVHQERPYFAFSYEDAETGERDFYDEEAKPLQSFFLKAPLNYTRISSRYSPRRFHPVQKRWKAHKGTDYAAPHGTPIWSTADGTVVASGYTSGNGNYVKVKHNNTYTTQYLHMSKRNVRVGQRVKQGDIIGYVGSTGLATGPHVCYRFWVNGRQVDPFRQDLPSAEPLDDSLLDSYFASIEPLKSELASIEYELDQDKESENI